VAGAATATYSTTDGQVVSISYSFDNPNTYGTFVGCTVVGQAIGS
jgi:hypothetical protein